MIFNFLNNFNTTVIYGSFYKVLSVDLVFTFILMYKSQKYIFHPKKLRY